MNVDEPVEYSDSTNLPTTISSGRSVPVSRRSLFDLEPAQQVQKATEIANALADVIEKQKLYSVIQGKKHVRVEGWSLMGTFLGILPREKEVKRMEDGSYEAKVELVKALDGTVLGAASAICSVSEKRWGASEDYARRSMAITRATGKAYRLAFSWIITLAGYSPTPEEEMPADADVQFQSKTNRVVEPQSRQSVSAKTAPQQNVSRADSKAKVYDGSTKEEFKEFLANEYQIVDTQTQEAVHTKLLGRPKKDLLKILKEMEHGSTTSS